MSYADYIIEDLRLSILRLMAPQEGYALNEFVIASGLKRLAHLVSRDRLRTELAWLEEQGLLTSEEVMGGVRVARLTDRGLAVSQGVAVTPGVKRPAPGL